MNPEQGVGRERGLEGLGWRQIMAAPKNSATTPQPAHGRTQARRRPLCSLHAQSPAPCDYDTLVSGGGKISLQERLMRLGAIASPAQTGQSRCAGS